ncbi:DUF4190 domain-containing protein [Clavibacter phaseoli]|jgi:hypothetical protein|uniref:DUF4190 domain-containing protein n=1 Tax=Clavibacter phaseoli TaxID=1734031 RepID=A0A8I0SE16_9MICO|nr:DUF4190 domain-containing protein [Clavibacter phaseoli]MBF4631705.1 DUF4190 domain-containing protein [Clavibacter phaseoli]MBM7387453.1 flagellar basal body-associated protein FliL [Clavibacter michiganensis]RII92916.1 DUF4190 domain-containing protein [Clavibacter michiganensis]RIJ59047.1 DUF4190 domain-containing protein [Clavibacter phaseoli]
MTDPQNPDRSNDGFPPAPSQPAYPAAPAAGSDSPYAASYQPGQGGAPKKGLAITSMVLGIVSVVLSLPLWFLTFFVGIAAIITGVLARKRNPGTKGFWLTGIILGIVGVLVSIVVVLVVVVFVNTAIQTGEINGTPIPTAP